MGGRLPWREPLLSALLASGAVGLALVSQHQFDMQPCPWCILQRLVFVCGALLALVELAAQVMFIGKPIAPGMPTAATAHHTPRGTSPVWALLLPALRGLRGLLAVFGMAAAMWQHLVASASASCNLTLADRLIAHTGLDGLWPEVFQPRASCLEAKAWLLGIPYEFWSAALFVVLGALALSSLMQGSRSTLTRGVTPDGVQA